MTTFFIQIKQPLKAIHIRPYQFAVWFIVANIFGLIGFWLPLLLLSMKDQGMNTFFLTSINAGVLASFSIVILSNGVAAAFSEPNAGTNKTASGIRALICIVAVLFIIIHVGLLIGNIPPNDYSDTSMYFQIIFAIIAIAISIYLYCFRFPDDWEDSLENRVAAEQQEVNDLTKKALEEDTDDHGVQL